MPRFLVDESLPRAVTRALLASGHDALDSRDIGLRGRPDVDVHERAVLERCIVAAADTDFANALRFPPGTHPGVVVLRAPDEWGAERRARRFVAGLVEAGIDRLAGAIVIIEPARTRVFGPSSGPSGGVGRAGDPDEDIS